MFKTEVTDNGECYVFFARIAKLAPEVKGRSRHYEAMFPTLNNTQSYAVMISE